MTTRKQLAEQADGLAPTLEKLAAQVKAAGDELARRRARKALKRAQRKQRRLRVLAAGGKHAMEKAAKAAG